MTESKSTGGDVDALSESLKDLATEEKIKVQGLQKATYNLVDTADLLEKCLDEIEEALKIKNYLNVDFEGIDLCKTGKVCIGQFSIEGSKHVYLVDFVVLVDPFKLCDGRLKRIMESPSITKVFFDPRNDCDAIYHQFQIQVSNALCLQVSEVAFRRYVLSVYVKYVFGLKKVMEKHLPSCIDELEYQSVSQIKERGAKLFVPESGGSYQVFNDRPLQKDILNYCIIDVLYFDELRQFLFGSLTRNIQKRVLQESTRRLTVCLQPGYDAKAKTKSLAPKF